MNEKQQSLHRVCYVEREKIKTFYSIASVERGTVLLKTRRLACAYIEWLRESGAAVRCTLFVLALYAKH